MAASSSSSSGSWIYDVFPSFSGEVRNTFLSHLLAELKRKSINTFMDDKMERSCPIGEELISAIRESRIAIVIFSINYASSTWCLDELVEIHKCYKERNQMVIPIFYKVDPSDVSEQVGKFGEVFQKTCENVSKEKQPDDQKQKWKQALADIAKFAGKDVQSWHNEAATIQKIASDVFNKLNTPSKCSDDLVGIEAHLEKIESILCLESEDARMVGIWGQSGIGKSTIGRELFRKLSREKYKFALHAFLTYRSTNSGDVYGMKLSWEKELLSEIFSEKDIEIKHSGKVEQKLKRKKVLIVLDDVDDLEFLKTLVGKTEWFGPGSRIIVITQNRQLLRAHKIDIIYEVELPSEGLARKMLCRYAFGQDDPPDEFRELADEVAKLAGNLPLGLRVLGSSLKENPKGEWVQMMPSLRTGLNGDIMKTLRVSYDRLDKKDQDMFHYIGYSFCPYVVDLEFNEDKFRLQKLVEKSLVRITPRGTIEMHNLLEKLAREIDCEESGGNLRKRRYLTDYKEIQEVLTNKIGTETVLGIHFKEFLKTEILSIDKNSFEGMRSLQHLEVHESCVDVPQGLDYLPSKLRTLIWLRYSLKCLPSSFKAECLVKLIMRYSDLEKLWEGTQPLGSLKMLNLSGSRYLKEIPDLSNAINLEKLFLNRCESLVTLPSSINATKLRTLAMSGCTKLESIPTPLILESLDDLWLSNCSRLRNFPQIEMKKSISSNGGRIEIEIEDCLWNKNLPGLYFLDCLMRCIPCFRKEYLFSLTMRGSKMLEKLWEGAQSIGSLENMDLSECENLKEIPDLSKATNLVKLKLNNCISLEKLPSTIGNLHKLVRLEMKGCTGLKVLPTDVNLSSLETLDLSGCSSLRTFPQISNGIKYLYLENTAIEKIPSCIVNFTRLTVLMMYCCKLRNISPEIFRLTSLKEADFTGCIVDIMGFTTMEYTRKRSWEEDDRSYSIYSSESLDKQYANFIFRNCFKLDRDARELIIRSCFKHVSLPCGEVPTYFTHRAYGNTVNVTLPQSSLYQEFLRFKVCIVVDFLTNVEVGWCRPTDVSVGFNGIHYEGLYMKDHLGSCKTDHLIFWCLKFKPEGLPSKLAFNDVEFKFSYDNKRIKECGVRFLNVTGEKGDVVVEVGRSKKRMRMTAETSEEHINLPYDQIVADTGLAARNLELSLGQGEKSSVSSYHSLEVETLCVGLRDGLWITEQQDEEIPIMVSGTGRTIILSYMRKAQDLHWKGMRSSIFGLPDIRQNTPVQTESSQLAQTASHNKPKFPHNKLKLTKKVYVPKLAKLKITPKPVNSAKASQSENPANKVQQPALSLQESSQLAQTASHNKPKFPHNKLKLTKKVYVPKLAKLKITPKPVNSAKASQSENPANKVQQPALSLQEQDKHKAKDKETVTQVQGKRRTCTEPMPTHNRFEVLDDECTN